MPPSLGLPCFSYLNYVFYYVFFTIIYRELVMPKYDFLIIGAGLFGATCARLLTNKGYKCLIMEKRSTRCIW